MQFVNYANRALSDQDQVDVVYTDFSKAFDSVSHAALLDKLEKIGLHSSLLLWIKSYLSNRQQCVKLYNVKSEPFNVTSGVPQGSHIGPLLFILFINDLFNNLNFCQCLIYADDVKMFCKISSLDEMTRFQRDLNKFSAWCINNRLNLNVNKCKHVSFYRGRIRYISHYHLLNVRLETLNEIRDLGVLFSYNLSFNMHIDAIIAKAQSMLGFLKRICKDFTCINALKSVYYAHVRSHLEYANIVWNPFFIYSNRPE